MSKEGKMHYFRATPPNSTADMSNNYIADLCEERDALKARVKELEEALRFYANSENYIIHLLDKAGRYHNAVTLDGGRWARAALSAKPGEPEEEG